MSEKKYRAWLATTASASIEFTADVDDVPEDERREVLEDAAHNAFPGVILCWQCSHQIDLGDFEVGADDDAIEAVA